VIVRFVDIGGIVDHDCLNFLFIIVGLVNFLLGLIKFYPTSISELNYYHTPRDEVVGEYAGFTMSVRLSTRL
jgi:hypothetical protein